MHAMHLALMHLRELCLLISRQDLVEGSLRFRLDGGELGSQAADGIRRSVDAIGIVRLYRVLQRVVGGAHVLVDRLGGLRRFGKDGLRLLLLRRREVQRVGEVFQVSLRHLRRVGRRRRLCFRVLRPKRNCAEHYEESGNNQ